MRQYESFAKEKRFDDLQNAVQYCSICARLAQRTKVLSKSNGYLNTKVLFVAEAPGRLGADRTGVPLHGDRTGDIFESLIANIGWTRDQFFISNALLCNPRDEKGNNCTPTKTEILNCNMYLSMTMEVIQPEVVIPLGNAALDSLSLIAPHNLTLREDVGRLKPWHGKYLFPLYHPGPRALIHRSLAKQRSDYMQLAKQVDPIAGVRIKKLQKAMAKVGLDSVHDMPLYDMILIILRRFQTVSMFKLTKLLYLSDLLALNEMGRTISGEIYLRQQEGPWLPSLKKIIDSIKNEEVLITRKRALPYILLRSDNGKDITLNEKEASIVLDAIERYGKMNDAEIKTATYLSAPMRYILRQEKLGRDMRRVPVIYKDKHAIDLDSVSPKEIK